jgi:hypothetical protein
LIRRRRRLAGSKLIVGGRHRLTIT